MSLENLVDNNKTDKNTLHSYLPLYQMLFQNKKHTAKNVLEVGIANGGSIKLWNQFFPNATIYGVDIIHDSTICDAIKNNNVKLFTLTNAYDINFIYDLKNQNITFDILIDDGPHTLQSMKDFIDLYLPLLSEDGILIIEDIQSIDWLQTLTDLISPSLQRYIKTYDLRNNKNRYDDILFTIDKFNL